MWLQKQSFGNECEFNTELNLRFSEKHSGRKFATAFCLHDLSLCICIVWKWQPGAEFYSSLAISLSSPQTFWLSWVWLIKLIRLLAQYLSLSCFSNHFSCLNIDYWEKTLRGEIRWTVDTASLHCGNKNVNQLKKLEAAKAAWPLCLCLLGLSVSFCVFLLGPSGSFYDLLGCFRSQYIPSITNPK